MRVGARWYVVVYEAVHCGVLRCVAVGGGAWRCIVVCGVAVCVPGTVKGSVCVYSRTLHERFAADAVE